MSTRLCLILSLATIALIPTVWISVALGCCPVSRSGMPVVNADQTVIILWDAASRIEHMIRKASFKCTADDFGFIVPTPSQPELDESGNDAFPYLQKITEPETKQVRHPIGISCGCSKSAIKSAVKSEVRVLVEKEVAGFKAAVLDANSASALVGWLKDNGYNYSPQIEAWAKPYVTAGWKFTALKIAKSDDGSNDKTVKASALRISFKTDKPLFPYREPDPQSPAEALGARKRLLRIYFLSDGRMEGNLAERERWSGRTAWANTLSPEQRAKTLQLLGLPKNAVPEHLWLTEFEDNWQFQAAPADLYFATAGDQNPLHRDPIIQYVTSFWPADITVPALATVLIVPPLVRRYRRKRKSSK